MTIKHLLKQQEEKALQNEQPCSFLGAFEKLGARVSQQAKRTGEEISTTAWMNGEDPLWGSALCFSGEGFELRLVIYANLKTTCCEFEVRAVYIHKCPNEQIEVRKEFRVSDQSFSKETIEGKVQALAIEKIVEGWMSRYIEMKTTGKPVPLVGVRL